MIVFLEVRDRFFVDRLHVKGLHDVTHSKNLVLFQSANRAHLVNIFLVVSDNQTVNNLPGKVRVDSTLARFVLKVAIQAVTSIEELADVSADVVFEHEATPGMLVHELTHIEHVLIQDDQLLALTIDKFVKLGFRDVVQIALHAKGHLFLHLLAVKDFSYDQDRHNHEVADSQNQ